MLAGKAVTPTVPPSDDVVVVVDVDDGNVGCLTYSAVR